MTSKIELLKEILYKCAKIKHFPYKKLAKLDKISYMMMNINLKHGKKIFMCCRLKQERTLEP